jgi:hypothetical protein
MEIRLRSKITGLLGACIRLSLPVFIAGGCGESFEDDTGCDRELAAISFDYSFAGGSGTFCSSGSFAYWQHEPEAADAVPWVHALRRLDSRWILLVAYAPGERGQVNRITLYLPQRLGNPGSWNGTYNLGCASSTDYAADDCWGYEEIGYCLASADPEEQAQLPDCLAGWPRGSVIVHRVGFVSGSGSSDEEYEFESGQVTLHSSIFESGHVLNGSFHGTLRAVAGTNLSNTLTITNGHFNVVVRNSPFWF